MAVESSAVAASVSTRLVGAAEFIVKLVVIGVPVLYALGRTYAGGYWQALHLPASLMDYAAEDFLYMGFVSLFSLAAQCFGIQGASTAGYVLLMAAVIALVTVVLGLIDHGLEKLIKSRALKVRTRVNAWRASKHAPLIRRGFLGVEIGSGMLFVGAIGVLVFFSIAIPMLLVAEEGGRRAEDDLRQLRASVPTKHGGPVPQATFSFGEKVVAAPLLQCSAQWCVVLLDGRLTAIPQASLHRIEERTTSPKAVLPIPGRS